MTTRATLALKLRLLLDRLQLRERVLLLIALILALAAACYAVGNLADISDHQAARQQLEQLNQEYDANISALNSLTQARDNPVVIQLRERNKALEAELAALDQRLSNITEVLIPPQQMISVLRELVDHNDLTLVHLALQPVTEIRPADADQGALYQHRLQLTLTGNLDDLSAYLRALEELPWQLFWDRLSIATTRFPELRIRLDVHTLSDQEIWMNI